MVQILFFNLSGGVFSAENLSNAKYSALGGEAPLVNSENPSFIVRAIANEITGFSDFTSSYIGISYCRNDDFDLINIFSGIGIYEYFSLLFEYMYGRKTDFLSVDNYMIILNYHVFQPVFLELRYEEAKTNYLSVNLENINNQIVAGVHFFPLPYIELKGEIRYMKTREIPQTFTQYEGALYYLQIHFFY